MLLDTVLWASNAEQNGNCVLLRRLSARDVAAMERSILGGIINYCGLEDPKIHSVSLGKILELLLV
jgi:hypothetical protein